MAMARARLLSAIVLLAAGARAAESAAAADNCTSDFWQRPTRLRLALVRHGESENNVHEAVSEAAYVAQGHRQEPRCELLWGCGRAYFVGLTGSIPSPHLIPKTLA